MALFRYESLSLPHFEASAFHLYNDQFRPEDLLAKAPVVKCSDSKNLKRQGQWEGVRSLLCSKSVSV